MPERCRFFHVAGESDTLGSDDGIPRSELPSRAVRLSSHDIEIRFSALKKLELGMRSSLLDV